MVFELLISQILTLFLYYNNTIKREYEVGIMNLFLILGLGLFLRIAYIIKPEGLWNDEYITFSISMLKFPFDFFDGIKNNCHAPLHYFYLKLFY